MLKLILDGKDLKKPAEKKETKAKKAATPSNKARKAATK